MCLAFLGTRDVEMNKIGKNLCFHEAYIPGDNGKLKKKKKRQKEKSQLSKTLYVRRRYVQCREWKKRGWCWSGGAIVNRLDSAGLAKVVGMKLAIWDRRVSDLGHTRASCLRNRSFWSLEGTDREIMSREGKWAVDGWKAWQGVEGILSIALCRMGATERL